MGLKIIPLVLLTVILLVAGVSALGVSVSTPETLTQSDSQTSFTVTNTGSETINFWVSVPSSISDGKGNSVAITSSVGTTKVTNVAPNAVKTVILSSSGDINNLVLGEFSGTVTVHFEDASDFSSNSTQTTTLKLANNFCEAGEKGGNLSIKKIKFTNLGFGDKDEWYITDEVEVELRVENNGEEDIDDIVVAWGLYNKKTGEWVMDDEESEFNLDQDEDETLTFTFKLDPEDFDADDNEDDFVFYVKAYSDDLGESKECNSETEDVTLVRDKHFVIINNINFVSESIPCDELLEGEFEVWNIGDDDEQDVSVVVSNKELGIDETFQIGDLDVFDDKKVSFSYKIPRDAKEKNNYVLKFEVYDEDNNLYENDDNKEAVFTNGVITVEGNCGTGTGTGSTDTGAVQISAVLDSETPEAKAGEQVIIQATLKNIGTEETTYTLSVFGNSAWSTLSSIDPQTVTLAPNTARNVNIILSVDEEAEGAKELTIRATHGEKITEQRVAMTVVGKTPDNQQVNSIVEHIKANWFIYLIVLVNVILIIAIIIVISRMVSRV